MRNNKLQNVVMQLWCECVYRCVYVVCVCVCADHSTFGGRTSQMSVNDIFAVFQSLTFYNH